jgi:amphi-Trp domain-containing protein
MGKEESNFRHESLQNTRSIIAYLDALREGFRRGTLTFSDPHGEIDLHPNGIVRMEVHADQKRERSKLVLTFEWKERTSGRSRSWPLVVKAQEE